MSSTRYTRSEFLGQTFSLSLLSTFAWGHLSRSGNKKADRITEVIEDRIKKDWQIALDRLNPTAVELERGLELHREFVVMDTYGFMPRAALDGDALRGAIEEHASNLELQDLREEMNMTRYTKSEAEKAELERAWGASGVTCVVQNAGEEGNAIDRLLKRLARFTWTTDIIPDVVSKAVRPEDIEAAHREKRHVLYFTGNGVPLPQTWVTVEEELAFIRIFFQLGIRMMHMTYNRRNAIGDGCAETANGGLSDFGRHVVAEMNRIGVIPDVSHSGWQTSLETAQLSEKPVVASHTTAAEVYHHIRSKPDEVITAIADTGGYVGVCCIPRFLGGSGDIAAMMRHIDYIKSRFGADHVAIGTDVAYTSRHASVENQKVPAAPRTRTRWAALWPEDRFTTTAEMRSSLAWTNWPLYTTGLVQLGYSDCDIEKIIGGNALRVAKANFNESHFV